MAKNKTEKSPWYSKRAEGYISDSQYLAEFICERLAAAKKLNLVGKFWNLPEWQKVYKQQLRLATKLLKLYSIRAILEALKSREGKNAWSLAATWLDPLITREQNKLDNSQSIYEEEQEQEKIEDFSDLPLFAHLGVSGSGIRKAKPNLLKNLRELDG